MHNETLKKLTFWNEQFLWSAVCTSQKDDHILFSNSFKYILIIRKEMVEKGVKAKWSNSIEISLHYFEHKSL